jgi:hypothetical protein
MLVVPLGFISSLPRLAWDKRLSCCCCCLWMLNSTYITLLPIRLDAKQVKDFRPISLVHSFAKLVTKILANRLAGHLDKL